MSDERKALEILWSIGLHPGYYDNIVKAAEGVREMVEHFRRENADPPAHLQEVVFRKFGIYGFTGEEPARFRLVEIERPVDIGGSVSDENDARNDADPREGLPGAIREGEAGFVRH